jgi:acetylglutamate kinase
MVYAGYINKNIVASLQAKQCNAIGLSGTDGNLISAHKRTHPVLDFGLVGDIDAVNTPFLYDLLEMNMTPVIAPVTHDQRGQLLNTNADTVATRLAQAMSTRYDVTLIITFEKKGVLSDIRDETSVIPSLSKDQYDQLKNPASGVPRIFAGMLPKLDNAFSAIDQGVIRVVIGHAYDLEALVIGTAGTNIIHE